MIRKKLKLTFTNNLPRSGGFFGAKIQLSNEPLFQTDLLNNSVIRGETIEDTVVNYKDYALQELFNLGLNNKILLNSDNLTFVEFDVPADGGWIGYGDGFDGDPQYLVYQNNDWLVKKYYSDYVGAEITANTTIYDSNTENLPSQQGVNGLDENNYYIDNDVYIVVSPENNGVSMYTNITVIDLQNQKRITSRMYFFNNNTLTFDLAIVIKGLMDAPKANFDYSDLTPYPINTNYGIYRIELTRYYKPENSEIITAGAVVSVNKTFIRGGVIDQVNNISAIENVPLRNSEKLPIWNGYPTAEYRLINGEILQYNDLTNVNKEYRPDPGCNAYYFKFKNRKGGYSYWMFNKAKEDISASNIGYSNNYGVINDFGSNIDVINEVSSKFPYAFKDLAFDLLTSSETYLYVGQNKWKRVIQKSNKVSNNTNKRVFDVVFKFDRIINYNPTI